MTGRAGGSAGPTSGETRPAQGIRERALRLRLRPARLPAAALRAPAAPVLAPVLASVLGLVLAPVLAPVLGLLLGLLLGPVLAPVSGPVRPWTARLPRRRDLVVQPQGQRDPLPGDVDGEHLDLDDVAGLHDVPGVLDERRRQRGDVHEPVLVDPDVDERAERSDVRDHA